MHYKAAKGCGDFPAPFRQPAYYSYRTIIVAIALMLTLAVLATPAWGR